MHRPMSKYYKKAILKAKVKNKRLQHSRLQVVMLSAEKTDSK